MSAIVDTPEEAAEQELEPLLVRRPLEAFLDAQGLGEGRLEAEPIGEGHSNVTFAIRRGGGAWVLRRPPRPPLPPSAHDVLREARLLSAVQDADVRTPRVLATCEDEDVIGAPFYVMDLIEGDVLTAELPPALEGEGARIGDELVDALVEVHAVDWRACGLEGYGKPTGYLERQLRRFGGLWEHNRTRELPVLDRLTEWLAEHRPESGEATIVHGDYRLGNAMFARGSPPRLNAIFDWELATIGDPLADLSATWSPPGRSPTTQGRAARARRRHAAAGVPDPRAADRALRGALGSLDVRRPLVHDAGAVEVGRVPRGLLQAQAGRPDRGRVLRPPRTRRAGDRRAGMANRNGLIVDYGGVLTTDVFASFRAFCEAEGLAPDTVRDRFRGDPEARELLARLETGALAWPTSSAPFAALLDVRPDGLIERLFAGMEPDEAMLGGVRAARRAGARTALLSNSWGAATAYDGALLEELFDAVGDLQRGRTAQARPGDLRARGRAARPAAGGVRGHRRPPRQPQARPGAGHGHRAAPRRRGGDACRGRCASEIVDRMAVDYFLQIAGVDGESVDAKHKGWIDIESFSWGATQPPPPRRAGPLPPARFRCRTSTSPPE